MLNLLTISVIIWQFYFVTESQRVADRIVNQQGLLHCAWRQDDSSQSQTTTRPVVGENATVDFNDTLADNFFRCNLLAGGVRFFVSSARDADSKVIDSVGGSRISSKASMINLAFQNRRPDNHICIALDYCISGKNSQISVTKNHVTSSTLIWSTASDENCENNGVECRELVKTIYEKDKKQTDNFNITIKAELQGVPSSFFFEKIAIFNGPCKIRVEFDYFREYNFLLSKNYAPKSSQKSVEEECFSKHVGYQNNYLDRPWPIAKLPFVEQLSSNKSQLLASAMSSIENATCIRFIRHSTKKLGKLPNYLQIVDDSTKQWCLTEERTFPRRRVVIKLGEVCWNQLTITRQLMHALGLGYEFNRPDRGFYVKILSENIDSQSLLNFDRHNLAWKLFADEMNELPYDYNSVMHIETTEFSRNASADLETVVAAKNGRIKLGSLGIVKLTDIDILKLRSIYCKEDFGCLTDDCPSDSKCSPFDQISSNTSDCTCITEKDGHPGSCLAIMEKNEKMCGPTSMSYGQLYEIDKLDKFLCLCKNNESLTISNNTCTFEKANSSAPSPNRQFVSGISYCKFGFRQLLTFDKYEFICDPVPVAVEISMTAKSLIVPKNLKTTQLISELNGLTFVEIDQWPDGFDNKNSHLYLSATKIIRLEILRALSLISYGDDSLLTKTSNYKFGIEQQEAWINHFGSIEISPASDLTKSFDIKVVVYFTQPIYLGANWLRLRLAALFGIDGAKRNNGLVFIREKHLLKVTTDVCGMFLTPTCSNNVFCQPGTTLGNVTECVALASAINKANDDYNLEYDDSGFSTLEVILILVAGVLGIVAFVNTVYIFSRSRSENDDTTAGIEMSKQIGKAEDDERPAAAEAFTNEVISENSGVISTSAVALDDDSSIAVAIATTVTATEGPAASPVGVQLSPNFGVEMTGFDNKVFGGDDDDDGPETYKPVVF